ncbi:MAG: hypothetical protein V4507_06290, partial [Verrucomicrobiota bacterium]
DFAVLYGKPAVYQSSGYTSVWNIYHPAPSDGKSVWKLKEGMVKPISGKPWPTTDIHFQCPPF